MAGLKRETNIFRVLETVRSAWASAASHDAACLADGDAEARLAARRRFLLDGEDVRERFLREFEDFLFSCSWTDSAVVREIVGYIKSGVPLNKIGNLVELRNSAFRMRMLRITETVNGLLFDGRACPEGIYALTAASEAESRFRRLQGRACYGEARIS